MGYMRKRNHLLTAIVWIAIVTVASSMLMPMEASAASKPGQVKSLKASSKSYNSIRLTWKKVKGAKGYQVYRATSKNGKYKKVKTTKSTSFTNGKLTTDKRYYYKVRAYKGSRKGKFSSKKSGVPKLVTPALSVSPKSSTSIKTSWKKVSGAKGYQIYRATSKAGKYSRIKTTSATSYTSTGLTASKTYYYKVRAYRKAGKSTKYSSYSTIRAAKTKASTPPAPKPQVPSIKENKSCYLPYKGTKIWIGQKWSNALNAQINQAATGSNKAVSKIIHRKGVFSNTDVYLYDTSTYSDFLIVYVSDNVLTGWNTTSDIFGVYHDGKKVMTLRTKNPASTYIDFVKDPPAGDRSGIWLSVFEEKMRNDGIYQYGDAIWGGLMTIDASSTYLGNLADESRFAEHIVNALRVKHNLNPLKHNDDLYSTITLDYAKTMAASNVCSHKADDLTKGPLAGTGSEDRKELLRTKKNLYMAAENAALSGGAEGLINGWYTSSGHKSALLRNDVPQTCDPISGIAIAGAKADDGLYYWAYHASAKRK